MAQLLFHVHGTFAVLQQQRGERVAQIMEPYLPQPGLLEQPVKNPVSEIVRVQEPAVLVAEHPGRNIGSAGPGVDLALKL